MMWTDERTRMGVRGYEVRKRRFQVLPCLPCFRELAAIPDALRCIVDAKERLLKKDCESIQFKNVILVKRWPHQEECQRMNISARFEN